MGWRGACQYSAAARAPDARPYPSTGASHPVSDAAAGGRRDDMPEHDTLPLPDYDHLPVSGLASRIRTLDRPGLQTLLQRIQGIV